MLSFRFIKFLLDLVGIVLELGNRGSLVDAKRLLELATIRHERQVSILNRPMIAVW